MFMIYQEADLPKLSQTSIYDKFNQTSGVTASVKSVLSNLSESIVRPDAIPEMIALMKLNGSPIIKKAIAAYEKGDIVVSFSKVQTQIPPSLPYIIVNQGGTAKCFMFADKVVSKLNNQTEYMNFMATLEAAYLALMLYKNPNKFINNRNLMFTLANVYCLMTSAPLEQRLYMKGENLTKAMIYIITYFYRMIDGDRITPDNIPYKRMINDKLDSGLIKQIVSEIKALPDLGFFNVLGLIKNLNPVRYKNLDNVYLRDFTSACGVPLMFGIENIGYLFMLVTCANYKSSLTQYNLNKAASMPVRKVIKELAAMSL